MHRLYVTAPAGTADLAAEELAACGATEIKAQRGGVACLGSLETAYRACLWSRVANRVLLPIAEFRAPTPEALYAGARAVAWHEHLAADGTLAVECTSGRSAITHTQYAALKVKDAVVDQFRDRTGRRPSVDVAAPGRCHTVRPGAPGFAARNASTKPPLVSSPWLAARTSPAFRSPISSAGRVRACARTISTIRVS